LVSITVILTFHTTDTVLVVIIHITMADTTHLTTMDIIPAMEMMIPMLTTAEGKGPVRWLHGQVAISPDQELTHGEMLLSLQEPFHQEADRGHTPEQLRLDPAPGGQILQHPQPVYPNPQFPPEAALRKL
jgi:hypothetical protein